MYSIYTVYILRNGIFGCLWVLIPFRRIAADEHKVRIIIQFVSGLIGCAHTCAQTHTRTMRRIIGSNLKITYQYIVYGMFAWDFNLH